MGILQWLEGTSLSQWVATSVWGYPIVLTAHSIGLALVVGIAFVMSARFLGVASDIPVGAMDKFFPWAWLGFAINAVSGALLFAYQATFYITNVPFLIKITAIAVAIVFMVLVQKGYKKYQPELAAGTVPAAFKVYGALLLISWSTGMVTGRLIAYLV